MDFVCHVGDILGLPLDCDIEEWLADLYHEYKYTGCILCIILAYPSKQYVSMAIGRALSLPQRVRTKFQVLLSRTMPRHCLNPLQASQLEMILRKHMPGAYVAESTDHKELQGLFLSQSQPKKEHRLPTFLSLPVAIRQRIYDFALTDENHFRWDDDQKILRASISPSLLKVSRSIRQQTLSTPLRINKVLIDASPKTQHPNRSPDWYVPASPNGREQLLELLTSLSEPRATTPSQNPAATSRNTNSKWEVEIREPYLKVWGYDVNVMVAYLRDTFPRLVITYVVLIPAELPRPVFKVQHIGRQFHHAISQGFRHPRFKVRLEGIGVWETAARGSGCKGREVIDKELEKLKRYVELMNDVGLVAE